MQLRLPSPGYSRFWLTWVTEILWNYGFLCWPESNVVCSSLFTSLLVEGDKVRGGGVRLHKLTQGHPAQDIIVNLIQQFIVIDERDLRQVQNGDIYCYQTQIIGLIVILCKLEKVYALIKSYEFTPKKSFSGLLFGIAINPFRLFD